MARNLVFLVLLLIVSVSISGAVAVGPITDRHRSAALDLFVPNDGSFGSLEETYKTLRTFQILAVDNKDIDIPQLTCPLVVENLQSSSSELKDIYFALRVNSILKCKVDSQSLQDSASKLQKVAKDANSLLDLYYSIGSLVLIKEKVSAVVLPGADGIFHSIKVLSQSDGRWRYDSNSAESSTHAAGMALEALAGVISLAGDEVDQSMVGIVKNNIVKLFDSIKSYDDGSLYFDEEHVDISKYQGPLSTTASVVRGLDAFAAVSSGKINIQGDKILGLAKFFLSIGIPGSTGDLFNQIESLSFFEKNRLYIPLILSLPASVLSLSSKDVVKVKVTTVFGSASPSLTVNLKQVLSSDLKSKPVLENQELKFDPESSAHFLDIMSNNLDVGKYFLVFEILLHDPEHMNIYVTGSQIQVPIFFTGFINVDGAEIAVLDSDVDSVDTKKKLDLAGENSISLSANHLQKLRLSFKLTTPLGHAFVPHQVFLKLNHETKVEHIFELQNSGKEFNIVLDFLGLVEKLYYLSGRYDLQLTIGDAVMENSFLKALGHVELDLPNPPEKAARPPLQPIDPALRFGPKPEISHIFRAPEKRPPKELSLAFLVLTLLPLLGFLVGLIRLGVNLKNFPSATLPALFSVLFHAGIAAVLSLYVLFWLKLDFFTTLKVLGLLGIFLIFVGHGTLSHLASASTKLKSS